MDNLINVMDRASLGQVVKKVPFIEGAQVTFLGDVAGDFFERFNQQVKETSSSEAGFWSLTQIIVDWNFSGTDNQKLPITMEVLKQLPLKLQRWLFKESTGVLNTDDEAKKGLPANS